MLNRLKKKKMEDDKKIKINKSCLNLIPERKYDDRLEAFLLKDGSYMDILRIDARDIYNMGDDDLLREIYNLIKIYKTVGVDLKFLSMNFPLNTSIQQEVLYRHKEKAEDNVKRKWIDRQITELVNAESGISTKEYYIMFFGKNENTFIKNREAVTKYTGTGNIKLSVEIDKNEKIQVLTKLCNMNTDICLKTDYIHKEKLQKVGSEEIDAELFEKLQSKGGVAFTNPSYITFGDGYVRCLHIYELPTYINEFWLDKIFNIPGTICSLDVSSQDINVVKKNITKSIAEEGGRQTMAKNYSDLYDAQKREKELMLLYDNISSMGEVIKLCDFRIFIKAKSLAELEERSSEILKELEGEGYKATTLLNEQKREFESLFESYQESHQKPFYLKGLSITSEQLAMGFPFNYSQLLDEEGVLLGFSKIGGAIIYDPFSKTSKRKHYNAVVCGDMGSGKSTHLKKLFKHSASVGNYIRVFDISGEFADLTREFGGKIIKWGSNEGMLNPLEILKAGDDDNTSYAIHISKLQTLFKCIIPSMDDHLFHELGTSLKEFYSIYGLTPEHCNNLGITGRKSTEYPILGDFRGFLTLKIEEVKKEDKNATTDVETTMNVDKAKLLSSLLSAVENLISNYGKIFNGYSTVNNITNEKIVCFDISEIKDLDNIFKAQMQILVALCWDNAVTNGKIMKEAWEKKKIKSEEVIKFLLLIDESHRWINTSMPLILDMVVKYMREARKYFAGIVLASQSLRDFMPEGGGEHIDKIKPLFELSQYKFMFKQDSSVKKHIQEYFSYALTPSQIDSIPFLETGETIMSIAGDRSIEFKEWLSKDYEEELFSGGR